MWFTPVRKASTLYKFKSSCETYWTTTFLQGFESSNWTESRGGSGFECMRESSFAWKQI